MIIKGKKCILTLFIAVFFSANALAQSPELSFQPILCPFSISLSSEGVSFRGSMQISTPLGTFAIDQKLATISDSPTTTHFIVRHLGRDHVYKIDRRGKIKLRSDGRTDIAISAVPNRSNVFLIEIEQQSGTVGVDFEPEYVGKVIAELPLGSQSFELASDKTITWKGLTSWSRSLSSVKEISIRQTSKGPDGQCLVSVSFKDGIAESPWTALTTRSGNVEFAIDEFKKRLAELGNECPLHAALEELRVSTSPGTVDIVLMSNGSLWQDAFLDSHVDADAIESVELEWGFLSNTMTVDFLDAAQNRQSLAVSFAGNKNSEVLTLYNRLRKLRPDIKTTNNGIR